MHRSNGKNMILLKEETAPYKFDNNDRWENLCRSKIFNYISSEEVGKIHNLL